MENPPRTRHPLNRCSENNTTQDESMEVHTMQLAPKLLLLEERFPNESPY